ncbi:MULTISPECIES: transporter substrate-binding domain-containing protein [unclassified Buttiauxella]|uniref:transporter substrate-binding domain-containing protein n=1 Tax=unclassified Buttiauxella TaxID=2634062 RepID=UPI001E371F5A|nr:MULTISPECIES: transporter substrate-binding domain-containing protein [unclassified Buttiauxella]MCE0813028.1 transporter substrate-binding domain-containing protein [Buttiauxella sp. S04-F03]
MKKKHFLNYVLSLFLVCYAVLLKAETNMSTLERISNHKVINIGYRDAPPYSYKTSDGHVVGYVIDLCKDVTESLKKNLRIKDLVVNYIPTPVSMRTTMLNHNIIDMDCSVNTDTVKRESVVLFSRHYLSVYTRFGSFGGSNINSNTDLAGRTVSVVKGTTDLINVNSLNRLQKLNIMVLTQPTMKDSFSAMSSHKSYATAMNEVSLKQLIESSENMKGYQISTLTLGPPQDLGIMLRHNDIALKHMVDENLNTRFNRSDFKQFYEQWFNSKLPGKNINLHLPLSAEMYQYITKKS